MTSRGISRGRGSGFTGGRGPNNVGFRGGRGGSHQVVGPPTVVQEIGFFLHACDGQMVCESVNPKIPYFNAPIYLENKTPIGKIDEVLGPINQVYFTIKTQDGIVATSFKPGDKFYIGGDKLLPLDKFLPKPKPPPGTPKPKRAGGAPRGGPIRGRGRGGRGGLRPENSRGGGFASGRGRGRGGTRGNSTFSRSGGYNRGRRS